jgi:hypothetical protein
MTKALLVTVLIFVQLTACVHSESEIVSVASPNAVASQTPSPEPSRTVLKESGWQIPGLKNSVAGKRVERKSENSSKVSVTKYVPGYIKGKPPRLEPSFFTDEERRTLRFFSSNFDLVVSDIWGYDVQGKTFCYQVHVHPQGIGATIILYFYDLDGDERFETVKQLGGFNPELPSWVK